MVKVAPLTPPCRYDIFTIIDVQPTTVALNKKSSGQAVSVPGPRIAEVLVSNAHEPPSLRLEGRLQWLTVREEWKFFAETPDPTDGLALGFAKTSPMQDPSLAALTEQFAAQGRRVSWSRKDKLAERLNAGYEVFYGNDGRYLYCPGRDVDSILVVSPTVR